MNAFLEVWGPDGATPFELRGDRMTVGRAEGNDLQIDDLKMSRRHAALERLAAGWCIYDLNSLNGTFVNGEQVERERPLYTGDEIQMGDTLFVYRVDRPLV